MAKTTKQMVRIHNAQTDEIIDREMTDIEFEKYQIGIEEGKAREAEGEAKAAERQAILDRLGLTADEAKLILG